LVEKEVRSLPLPKIEPKAGYGTCFFCDKWGEAYCFEFGSESYYICQQCLVNLKSIVKNFLKKHDQLVKDYYEKTKELSEYKSRERLTDEIIEEIDIKNAVNITKNLIIWKKGIEYFVKITDYQKGYWAETPLNKTELGAFLSFILKKIEPTKKE
jgi:hypothetical protein